VVSARLILGTARHIDQGKTSLVKALTGIVDVPGHERFIKNRLAGPRICLLRPPPMG
jgi:selenocysteine-specific translation elongation factor